jgi:enoyl-CoA hydratase/carnithine racemase
VGEYSSIERHEGWAEIVLNRPERRNSLIPPLANEITNALIELDADDDVAVIILRGEQGYFCSGIDLKALQEDPPPPWAGQSGKYMRAMHLALYHCSKPVIAALEKFAINAGAALAFSCDLVIGGDEAFLQIGEIQQGAGIPMNAAWLKIKTTEFTAARLAFYGDRLNTPDLVRLGLATESVPDTEVINRCREIAARIASFPKGAPQAIKRDIVNQRQIDEPESFFPEQINNALLTAAQVRD